MADTLNNYNTIGSFGKYVAQLNISYDRLHLKSSLISDDRYIIINSSSLINKYYDYILASSYTITLTDKELLHYKFQPKLYCYDKFGTTELWAILLKINNWTSVTEFNKKKFKVFTDRIFDILNEIMILEADNITENKELVNY